MEVIFFFSIFLIKEEQQEMLVQIIDAINDFINNPLCRIWPDRPISKSSVLNIYSNSTRGYCHNPLILAGIFRIDILAILVTSWIIGAAIGYYAGLSSNKLIAIFTGRRKETETVEGDNNNNAFF
jgi:hypothetical protein